MRFPVDIQRNWHLHSGSKVVIENNGDELIVKPQTKDTHHELTIEELFANYNNGFLHEDELDWGEPAGEELW
jgi:antitoxin component of MazEF toxin-antitoxin module